MSLLPVEDALSRVTGGVRPTAVEFISLSEAAGRVLAEDLVSKRTQPPFDASAMDGYACRAADVACLPATLRLIGESAAGARFAGTVAGGQSVRIFTGAPVPQGADTIVIQENVECEGDKVRVIDGEAPVGTFVRPRGLDFCEGDTLIISPLRLTAPHIALAAAMNHPTLPVRRKPRVAILATGTELVAPGTTPGPDQIIASNSYGLAAMVRALGGEVIDLGIVKDDREQIVSILRQTLKDGPEVLVTLGGASVGDHDLVRDALADVGFELDFWKIAMRPGKPLIFANHGGTRLLGLPGNPVSAMVCGRVFLWPLIEALLGLPASGDIRNLPLAEPIGKNGPRQDYMRAIYQDGKVAPYPTQDSSMLSTLASANALIIRPPHAPPIAAGETVKALMLDM